MNHSCRAETKHRYKFITSESVSEGHPDKVADQIADAILYDIISEDPFSRVACEVLIKSNTVFVCGEISSTYSYDIDKIVRRTLARIGYDRDELGCNANSCDIIVNLTKQSENIAHGVDRKKAYPGNQGTVYHEQICAGDQGIMFGYATDESDEMMPLPILYAHRMMMKQAELRKSGAIPWLLPDAKTQVTFVYLDGKPLYVDTVILSTQHTPEVTLEEVRETVIAEIIQKSIPEHFLKRDIEYILDSTVCVREGDHRRGVEKHLENTKYIVNPAGKFVIGGPKADCGLTGRKLLVDTYGGVARHGGGAFSGKDPTKVDRSATYMCRYIAKNIVSSGISKRCEVQLSYCIGMPEPISIDVETFGTSQIPESKLIEIIKKDFQLGVGDIINSLSLLHVPYEKVAAYGHFGRKELDLPWERCDKAF